MNTPSSQPKPDPIPVRKTPVRPAVRPFRAIPSTDPNPYRVEEMPRFWHWHVGIFGFACILAFGLTAWRGHGGYWIIPFVAGIGTALHHTYGVRCPQCRRFLRVRRLALGRERYLHMYDCPACRVSWDSHLVSDPNQG